MVYPPHTVLFVERSVDTKSFFSIIVISRIFICTSYKKITMIKILLLCLISTRHALSQTVSWTVGTSVPRFNEDLKLVCTVSTTCCTSSARIWTDGSGNQILNNGNSASPNKYEEDWDGGTSGFNLIIKNLQPTDVGVDYDCQYSLGSDKHTLTQDATWEDVPSSVSCPVTWSEGYLEGELNIARSAPSPTFFATYQGINFTSDLIIDTKNFNTWFYSTKVEIKKIIGCGDRFTLSVITGTTTTEICDAEIKCHTCPKCGGRCFGWGFFGIVLAGLLSLAVGCLCCAIKKIENGKVIKAVAISGIVFLVINAITALPIGSLLCFCYDYDDTVNDIAYHKGPLFALIGISSVFAVFTVLLYRCKGDKIDEYHAWIFFGVITYGIGLIIFKFSKGEKDSSPESGSPEKERADKKKERKPTEVVRPQPSRPPPSRAQHLKTDNTGREEYSTENEMFKPRPLPNISGHSDSPRPLPKRTPDDQLEKGGIQLEPLVDSTSEKKKRRKKKKKETKQSDEDD